jgi:Holliday junction resolvase RusA-like endonuclease
MKTKVKSNEYDRLIDSWHTIHGQVPSKSNSYRVIKVAGHGSMCKSDSIIEYEQTFFSQCPLRGAKIDREFKFMCDFYFRSQRSDLDNALKVVFDCLQTIDAIKNDNLCAEIHCRKLVDKQNPRIEFKIEKLI